MDLFIQLLGKKNPITEFEQGAIAQAKQVIAGSPALATATQSLQTDLVAGANAALSLADTALGSIIAGQLPAIKTALDHMVVSAAGLAGPVGTAVATTAVPPLVSDGVDNIAATLKTALDAWVLETKAKLSPPVAS